MGSYEIAAGVEFTGEDRVGLAGSQEYQGDWNLTFVRFETTVVTDPTPTPAPPGLHRVFVPMLQC